MKIKQKKLFRDLLEILRYFLPVFTLFITSFFIMIPAAHAADDSYKPSTLTIRGKVPLSPQFAYAMSKNSRVENDVFSPSINDTVAITLHLLGANDRPLPNQTIAMRISNYENITKTDETGQAIFRFRVAENMSGNMQIEFINLTYAEPIRLKTTLSFTVQDNQSSYKEWNIDIHEHSIDLISIDPFSFTEKINNTIIKNVYVLSDIKNGENNSSTTDCSYYFARAGPTDYV